MVLNCAHRGASAYYKENTMQAFWKAIQMGCDAIETDVHLSKDGRLVLIHDDTVNRTTTHKGYVKDYTFFELNKMGIPSLEELIVLVKRWNIILVLDIKTGPSWYEGIEERVVETVKRYHIVNKTIVSSFNHEAMVKVKTLCSELDVGFICKEVLYRPEKYCVDTGINALHPFYMTLTKDSVNGLHKAGIKVRPYTVNAEKALRRMIDMDVDMVITDYPERLKRILASYYVSAKEFK